MQTEKKLLFITWVLATVITLGLAVLGAVLLQPVLQSWVVWLVWVLIAGLWLWNFFYTRHDRKYWHENKKRQLETLTRLRDGGAPAREALKEELDRAARRTDVYTVVLTAATVWMCLSLSCMPGVAIIPVFLCQSLLYRFWPQQEQVEAELPVMEDQFPMQYALAAKAQEAVGQVRPFRIHHTDNCSASIFFYKGIAYLQLGAILLDCLSQEEVYQVMLHEFAHLQNARQLRRERHATKHRYVPAFFNTVDIPEGRCYGLLQVFASQELEEHADSMIRQQGDSQAAASAFAKIAYYGYYIRGYLRCRPAPVFYESERMPSDWVSRLSQDFRQTVQAMPEQAKHILQQELRPRVSTHPIMRDRIRALGVENVTVTFPAHQDQWGAEVKKTILRADEKLQRLNTEEYSQARKENYLEPKKLIQTWKNAGEPMTHEDTRQVLDAMYFLRQYEQVVALSQQFAQSGAPEHTRAHAIFLEGLSRLRMQDDSGIRILYQAIRLNRNYQDTAAEAIGDYCVTMGLEEQLQQYRAFADSLIEKEAQLQPVFPLRPKDHLEPAGRDDAVFRENLQVICQAGEGCLNRVFLVKKYTSDDTWDYVYLLDFVVGTAQEDLERVSDTVFMHLDKQEENYSLAYYAEDTGKSWLEKRPGFLIYEKQ